MTVKEINDLWNALDLIEYLASKSKLATNYVKEFKIIDDFKDKLLKGKYYESKSVL